MTTIKDIAEACNVSKSTVSRYLNKSGYVSEVKAKLIQDKIDELNFMPSENARNLSKRKSKVIGVVIPEADNPFFASIFKGISEIADNFGYSIFYCNTDNNSEKELKALNTLRSYSVEGLIITPAEGGFRDTTYSENLKVYLSKIDKPVVFLDRDINNLSIDGVFSNNSGGAYKATKALIDAGHKNIGIINGDQDLILGRERFMGYKKALTDSGLKIVKENIFNGNFTIEKAYKETLKLIDSDSKITALFSPNNLTTIGIVKALYKKNKKIPEDLALTCFDDIELFNTLNLNLSVVSRDTIEMGREIMKLLHKKMIADTLSGGPERVILEPKLILRGSEKKL